MNEIKKDKLKFFAASFGATFCLMGIAMTIALLFLNGPKTGQGIIPPQNAPGGAYLPGEVDDLTLLLVGYDKEQDITTTVLVGFYPKKGSIPVAVLPQQMLVSFEGKSYTIKELFKSQGAPALSTALGTQLGVEPSRYAVIQLDAFYQIMTLFGNVNYNLTQSLKYDENGLKIQLSQGMQQLDGRRTADIIRYPAYPGGEVERCRQAAALICAVINKNLPLAESDRADDVFTAAINLISTNITREDYATRKGAARFLARLSVQPANVITVSGLLNAAGNTFVLDEDSQAALAHLLSAAPPTTPEDIPPG